MYVCSCSAIKIYMLLYSTGHRVLAGSASADVFYQIVYKKNIPLIGSQTIVMACIFLVNFILL